MEKTYKIAKSKSRSMNPFIIFLFVLLVIFSVIFTLLVFYGFYNSFKPGVQYRYDKDYLGLPDYSNVLRDPADKGKLKYFPHLFYNYEMVLEKMPGEGTSQYYVGWNLDRLAPVNAVNNTVGSIVFNTILYSVGGSIIQTLVPLIMGYTCARYKYKFSEFLYTLTLFVMVMPLVGTGPARIRLLCRLNLFGTIWGDFATLFGFTHLYFLMFIAYFDGMSGTYAEAAEIDGASQFRTMVTIMLPLASKMVLTICILFFIGRWNDYTHPLIYLPNYYMISYRIYMITAQNTNTLQYVPAKFAGSMLIAIPILIVFVALRNKIMGNLTMGGVKE